MRIPRKVLKCATKKKKNDRVKSTKNDGAQLSRARLPGPDDDFILQ